MSFYMRNKKCRKLDNSSIEKYENVYLCESIVIKDNKRRIYMKKYLFMILFVSLSLVLFACQPKDEVDEEDQITLTYAAWNLGDPANPTIDRLMLEAFEEQYPNIKVEVIERPKQPGANEGDAPVDTPWNEFLATQASRGEFPDVFMPDNIPLSIQNGWVYDLSTIAAEDEEFANVATSITDAARYNDKLLALPMAANYFGFFVNNDVFEAANLDAPTFGTDWTTFMTAVRGAAQHRSSGIAGFEGVEHIMHWYPAQLNENYEWFTYDGEKFNLNSPEFRQAVELQQELYRSTAYVLESLSGEQRAEYFGNINTWDEGRQAVRFDGSWAIPGIIRRQRTGEMADFDVSFIGTPSVDGTQRIPMNLDFIAVGSNTDHPEEAYLLAKWMGFGKEGYRARVDLVKEDEDLSLSYAPLQPDEELLNEFFTISGEITGYREVLEHGNYIVEPVKFLPGYIQARYNAQYDADDNMWSIFNKLMQGQEDVSILPQVNERANSALQDAFALINDQLK